MSTFTFLVDSLYSSIKDGELASGVLSALVEENSNLKECEVVDFKRDIPKSEIEYAKLYKDMVCFHNSYGGFIIFGVEETEKDRSYRLIGVNGEHLDHAKIRDNLKKYTNGQLRFIIQEFQVNPQVKVEYIWISKRTHGDSPLKFLRNSPEDNGKSIFKKEDVPFRRSDTNTTATSADDYDFLHSERIPPVITSERVEQIYKEPLENNLPDRTLVCANFIGRDIDMTELWRWADDSFLKVKLIAGEGGLGKTSLAYHFAEKISARNIKPYLKVIWLSAKQKQFMPFENDFRDLLTIDFHDATSLLIAIYEQLAGGKDDYEGLSFNELAEEVIKACDLLPSFIIIDDVDSLQPSEQRRVLDFGLMARTKSKFLITTRVNFSYSPDNVLKLNGFQFEEYQKYVTAVRAKYKLPDIKDAKVKSLHETTSGSPLFTDSLFRLELGGQTLDHAITTWKEDSGQEVRKAALQREVNQLSKYAKRVLFVISNLKNCTTTELKQPLDFTEQTLSDAIRELSNLYLIDAPVIGKDTRYKINANTARLVLEIAQSLEIDHSALEAKLKSIYNDAIGISTRKRNSIVALAISEANAQLRENGSAAALSTILAASKRSKNPHPDLLLATGRFQMLISEPNYSEASKSFQSAYEEGCRKSLLYKLWFKAEFGRGSYQVALEVAKKAISNNEELPYWMEQMAEVHVTQAQRFFSTISSDAAIRELDSAIDHYRDASKSSLSRSEKFRYQRLIESCDNLKFKMRNRSLKTVINSKGV